jgi:rRNA maturation endonuclease Nob1
MGFFNDIGKKTTEVTSKLTKETKLKFKINDDMSKIENLYNQIGKDVYLKYSSNESLDMIAIEEKCKDLKELEKGVNDAKKEILILNNKKVCPKCESEIEKDAKFCPKCGNKLEIDEEKESKQQTEDTEKKDVIEIKKENKEDSKKEE